MEDPIRGRGRRHPADLRNLGTFRLVRRPGGKLRLNMIIGARIALVASLAVVPQVTLVERGGSTADELDAATTARQVQHAPHPATDAARTDLPGTVGDRFPPSPCAPPARHAFDVSTVGMPTAATTASSRTPLAVRLLPPSRAPPRIS